MKRKLFIFTAIFCLSCCLLWADSSEERPATSAEKAFFQNTWQKVMDLLPPPPAGVEKKPLEYDIPEMLGVGQEKFPFSMFLSCTYEKQVAMDQAMKIGMAMANDTQGMDKMNDEINRLTEELQKAAMAGDQSKMKEIQDKMQAAVMGNSGMAQAHEMAEDQKKKTPDDRCRS